MIYLGIDGCKYGWVVVKKSYSLNWELSLYKEIESLLLDIQNDFKIIIDIPIGLPQNKIRECDELARKFLGKRSSSVFITPCRKSVYSKNYEKACEKNFKLVGKKLSIQTWNICSKIKEIDILLRSKPYLRSSFNESHPELVFKFFNKGKDLLHSKKEKKGQLERIKILEQYFPQVHNWFIEKNTKFSSKYLMPDDILDGLCMAILAYDFHEEQEALPQNPEIDDLGLKMQILYPKFNFNKI